MNPNDILQSAQALIKGRELQQRRKRMGEALLQASAMPEHNYKNVTASDLAVPELRTEFFRRHAGVWFNECAPLLREAFKAAPKFTATEVMEERKRWCLQKELEQEALIDRWLNSLPK